MLGISSVSMGRSFATSNTIISSFPSLSSWCIRGCVAAPAASAVHYNFTTSSSSLQQDAEPSGSSSISDDSAAPASDHVETHSERVARLAAHPRTAGALRLMEEEKVQAMGSHEKRIYTQKRDFKKALSSHARRMEDLLSTRYQGWSVAALISHRVQQRRNSGSN